jgi:hypothetical protein
VRTSVLTWADSLDPRLQRYYLANVAGLASALVALSIVYLAGSAAPWCGQTWR